MEVQQPVLQSIYEPQSEHATQDCQSNLQLQAQGSVELRFSFTSPDDDYSSSSTQTCSQTKSVQEWLSTSHRPERVLNKSFSKLSFERRQEASRKPAPTTSTTAARLPDIPEMTMPKKEREGYGFSFSDSMFYDSDEYPDTECDWDSGTEKDPGPRNEPAPTTAYSFPPTFTEECPYNDVFVLRDVGSFYVDRPQKPLSCTSATREDTIRVKHTAGQLFKYKESPEIYAQLFGRLERMVYSSLHGSGDNDHPATTSQCALKLQNYLVRTKDWRIETGELHVFVEHEIEWAQWLVEASRTGVMHLKGTGCNCRPDWEEN
jgi:hypothetical protein